MDFHASLSDPRLYEQQIDRLHQRWISGRHHFGGSEDEVNLSSLVVRPKKISRLIAKTVGSGNYRSQPAMLRKIRVGAKNRVVFSYGLIDSIVHGAVAHLLEQQMSSRLSESLYSYRRGVSWWTAVKAFTSFVRQHRKDRPDPRSRGLYVLRRDVEAYTDTIPLRRGSPIWSVLSDLFSADHTVRDADWRLIQTVVRPEISLDHRVAVRIAGVPTGQPISCVLFNLYLDRLDHVLDSVPGGFYARYSDDIIFAHPSPDVAREADRIIDSTLAELGLRVSAKKRETLYFNGAGRHSNEWPEARGTTSLLVLGTLVHADATIGLGHKKLRRLLDDLEGRAKRAVEALPAADVHARGKLASAVINRALDPSPHGFQEASAPLLRLAVTDRGQLRQLDHLLARSVLKAVEGNTGSRAFRSIPYRVVRGEWGLISTLHRRNRHGKSR